MNKVYKWALVAAGVLALGFCIYVGYVKGTREVHRLTIVHVNDTHSHFEPERSGDYAGMGGSLERAAYVDSVRKADGASNVLLLHAGDFCQGTSYFSELGGIVEVEDLNAMGYDVVTLGNHEFDNGIEGLGKLLSGLNISTDLFGGNKTVETVVAYLDACVSAVAVVNGVLIFLRYQEQWLAWMVDALLEGAINILSGQYVLLVLKLGYLTNSTYGYLKWRRYIRTHEEEKPNLLSL